MSTSDDFYRAFEDRHRGTPQGIEERQRVYLPFLAALHAVQPDPLLVDLGCGRGEWLALARSQGWRVQGVDADSAMLQAAREAGLDAHQGDAVEFLRSLPASSAAAVSAFHLVEHLAFGDLRSLLTEAARVLVPGGVLMLETPNPENLVVGSSGFHMDPTHVRPLPPALLAFAVEFAGFAQTATLRLHEGIDESRPVELIDVLAGVSPDYAVVARTAGGAASSELDELFTAQRGVTLNALAERYDAQLRELRVNAELAREAALNLTTSRRDLLARLEMLEAGAALLQDPGTPPAPLRERVVALRHQVDVLQYEVGAMRASTSWRVTAPLRGFGEWRIHLANRMHAALERHPGVHGAARTLARALRLVPRREAVAPPPVTAPPAPTESPFVQGLTADARAAHDVLRSAASDSQGRKEA